MQQDASRPHVVIAARRPEDRDEAARALDGAAGMRVTECASFAEAVRRCAARDVDCLVLHLDLPDTGVFEALAALARGGAAGRVPVVVLASRLGEDFCQELVTAGAEDAVRAAGLAGGGLPRAIGRAIARRRAADLRTEALHEEIARARYAIANTEDGVWDWDVLADRVYWSDRWYRMIGYEPGAFVPSFESFIELVHPEDRERVARENEIHNVRATPAFEAEFRMRCADGSYRWILSRAKTIYDDAGRMVRVVGFHVDIDARRRAEQIVQRRNAGLELLNEGAAELLLTRDPDVVIETLFRRVAAFVESDVYFHFRVECDEHGNESLRLAMCAGIDAAAREAFDRLDFGQAVCGVTACERRPQYRPGLQRTVDPAAAALRALGLGVYACFPLIVGDELLGTLGFGSRGKTSFADDERTLLQATARQVAAVLDRTRREEAECQAHEQRRASEQRYRGLADAVPLLVWSTDAAGRAVDYNQRWFEYTGLDLDRSLAFGWRDVVHPEDLEPTMMQWLAAVASGTRFEMEHRLRRADGEYRWMLAQAVPIRDAGGRVVRWFGASTDVHDQKLAQEAQRSSEERARLALQSAELGAWEWDVRTGRVVWSAECAAIFGLAPESFGGDFAAFGAFVVDADRERVQASTAAALEAAPGAAAQAVEFRIRRPDGETRWLVNHGRTMHDERGRPTRIVGIVGDITSRKRAEEERERLLAAERAARIEADRAGRLKDEFLATISHELRTPLNSILGWSRLLLRSGGQKDMYDEGVRVIERNARVQAQLISDLLDVNRIVSGKLLLELDYVDVSDVAAAALETVQPQANDRRVELIATLARDLPPVRGDPARLQQVIWNLLSNAIKFTPDGGRVELGTREMDGHVEVEVRDTGQGIAPEFLPHVFDRFRQADGSTTRRHGGLGLGLAIVKQLAEMHGGEVAAESDGVGRGATFRLRLPPAEGVAAGAPPPDGRAAPVARESLRGVEVLLVDDQSDALEFTRRLLAEHGAEVRTASRAEEALDILRETRRGRLPQLLVSDIGMPGMDGYELLRAVRMELGLGPDRLPAVAVTAFAREDDRRDAQAVGYQIHLTKPFQPDRLIAVLGSLADRRPH